MPLPDELLLEILSRLPAKSIGKFRCVSIPWRIFLSTPEFVEKQFNHSRTHQQENLIFISSLPSLHTLKKEENFSKELEFLQGRRWSKFIGSCNGLVLLSDQKDSKFLVNPITQQQVKLPNTPLPLALKTNESFNMWGFGYDSSSNDYKIVTLSYYDYENSHKLNKHDTYVDLYSLKSGVWKRLKKSPYDHGVPFLDSGAFVNGALHWLACNGEPNHRSVIAAFDLVNEAFNKIPPPSSVDKEWFVLHKLVVLEGCLCMIITQENGWLDLWMMKVYGLEESWVKFNIIGKCEWRIVKPLCFIGENEVLLQTYKEEPLIVYDGRGGTFRNMIVDGVEADFIDGGVFMESLVSPDLREHPLTIDGVLFEGV